jgi:hypothetical protein
MNHRTKAYFDDLVQLAVSAEPARREPHTSAQPNACHANCDAFVRQFSGYGVVRGWLVSQGCWFIPHSVVRETISGRLIDITPEPTNSSIPFVEHPGSEEDFAILREGRDGGWPDLEPDLQFSENQ